MDNLIRVPLLNVLDHPHLVELGIVGLIHHGNFVMILIRLLGTHHKSHVGRLLDHLVVVAVPEFYLFDCRQIIHRLLYE